jgi:hypothetical protein
MRHCGEVYRGSFISGKEPVGGRQTGEVVPGKNVDAVLPGVRLGVRMDYHLAQAYGSADRIKVQSIALAPLPGW